MNDSNEEELIDLTDDVHMGTCSVCRGNVSLFRDIASKKEFERSGMCQTCQDEEFDIEEGYYGPSF